MIQITPTGFAKTGAWNGRRLEGERFTEEQKAAMIRLRGQTDRWDVRKVTVREPRERTPREISSGMPAAEAFVAVEVECPIIFRGGEQDKVIAPGGDLTWVRSNATRRRRSA